MKLSIIIPCRNEAKNLPILLDEVVSALVDRQYEIIVVDDGSTDNTAEVVEQFSLERAPILYLRHDRSAGKSAALRTGVLRASGAITVTLDGDGQNDPIYLPALVDTLIAAGSETGIAAGQRLRRTDTTLKKIASKIANTIRRLLLKDHTRDTGCGLKAIYTDLFRTLPFFDNYHRYLPALVIREGFKSAHVDVVDRERMFGQSNYGIIDRALNGALDLFGVWWLRRRRKVIPKISEKKYQEPR